MKALTVGCLIAPDGSPRASLHPVRRQPRRLLVSEPELRNDEGGATEKGCWNGGPKRGIDPKLDRDP